MAKSPTSTPLSARFNRQPLHPLKHPGPWLKALWQFSRPHTIIGTSFSVAALFAIALADPTLRTLGGTSVTGATALVSWLCAWVACLCGNVYIVGLNQVEDIAIDRINKPHLPIAAGQYTKWHGQKIVLCMGAAAIALALMSQNIFLCLTIVVSLLIGTAYSWPPVRLKRFPFWASMCILVVRGAIVNLGLYLYFATQFGLGMAVPARVWALMWFVLVFSFAIAIFKDIPDLEGDRRFNISTYTIRLGQRKVFNIARWVLTLCYGGMMAVAYLLLGVQPLFLLGSQGVCLGLFWWHSRRVQLDASPAPKDISYPDFYQFIWKLFFIQYVLFPLACWLA